MSNIQTTPQNQSVRTPGQTGQRPSSGLGGRDASAQRPMPRRGGGPRGGGPMGNRLPGEKPKDFKSTLKKLLNYLRPHIPVLITVLCLTITSTIVSAFSPRIMGQVTDTIINSLHATGRVDFVALREIVTVLASVYVCGSLLNFSQQFLMSGLSQKVVRNLRSDIDSKLSRLPLRYFDDHTHGEILSRVINDVDTISGNLQQSMSQIINSIVSIVAILAMMLSINLTMTLVTLLTIPLSALFTTIIARRSQPLFVEQQRTLGELNGHVEEMYTGHLVVKAFGREDENITRFKEINDKFYNTGWKAQFISGIIMPLINFTSNLGYVIICIVGGIMATNGTVSIGNIQSFLQFSNQFNQPINQAAQITNIMQSTLAAAERVFELLAETEQIEDKQNALTLVEPQGEVIFEAVKFGYTDIPVINNLNFKVNPGQMVAIVGPTGAGKTTMVNLLMRFYEISDGAIKVDGTDIRDLKRSSLRSLFGMVLQDTWLYNDTIANNIAYGKLDASREEIIAAASAAHADHFIRTLPNGYDTVLNEEASNISQGQRQLLTIARALLSDPTILILDEATSSVDTRTEQLIQSAMAALMKGRTSFVIAHRLSTIRDADLILVLRAGDIIEQGTHLELLEAKGFYADLYNSQFSTAGGTVDEAMGLTKEIG